MFLVSYSSEKRLKKIRSFLGSDENAPIAIILAAVQFEWIASRAILALGQSPTADLRKKVNRTSGLDAYVDLWRDEVFIPKSAKRLTEVVSNWQKFKEAFKARHLLVHGNMSASKGYALKHTNVLIKASEDIRKYAESFGIDLHTKLKTRQCPQKP